jgi:type II secretory pathway pseudopilin PulG
VVSCSWAEMALIELLVALVLLALLAVVIAWAAAYRVILASRAALARLKDLRRVSLPP